MNAAREEGLTIEIVDGKLVISIGIDALITAVRGADFWDDDALSVSDGEVFAAEIVRGLENEQEDGTTPVHLAFDAAAEWAVENGSDGIAFTVEAPE